MVLSRNRQALGEGARRDWDTAVGVTKGSSGTAEPRSSRELGHLKSTSQNKSRPRCGDPSPPAPPWRACARHPAHLRPLPAPTLPSLRTDSAAGRLLWRLQTRKQGWAHMLPHRTPSLPPVPAAQRTTGQEGSRRSAFFFFSLINECLNPHAKSYNPA